jgi:hypothetical protein
MRLLILAILCLCLFACAKADDQAEPTSPSNGQRDRFTEVSDRLLEMTEPHGWVVSRWDDASIEHTGDSLLWTGMAMGVLDCGRGAAPEDALLAMLSETGGRAYRHPTEALREPSLDGHLGLYWGIAHRAARCPESRERWAEALEQLIPVNAEEAFIVRDSILSSLGRGTAPSLSARDAYGSSWAVLASGVRVAKAAAYRIHLGLLALESLEVSGQQVSSSVRDAFCSASNGADMPTVDAYCGRGDLAAWVEAFEFDAWEMRHQRSGAWESRDGKPGLRTPGLDLLVAMRQVFAPLPFTYRAQFRARPSP